MKITADLFLTFAKIGAFTFGGGYAMISLIENECCTKKQWITHDEFMDMTVIAETTPGPVAINCATYVGYKTSGIYGAVLATIGVVLPSFLIILAISGFLNNFLEYRIVANAFKGIRAAVAILIIQAAVRMISSMIKQKNNHFKNIAFVVIFFSAVFMLNLLNISFSTIYLIILAGVGGLCTGITVRKGKRRK